MGRAPGNAPRESESGGGREPQNDPAPRGGGVPSLNALSVPDASGAPVSAHLGVLVDLGSSPVVPDGGGAPVSGPPLVPGNSGASPAGSGLLQADVLM